MHIKPAILIVDDLQENLTALEAVLQDCDARIFEAKSGNDALNKMLKEDFALVLLDVQMPGMDGLEVAELMRINPKTHHVPIIFITAHSNAQEQVFKGYDVGAVDYLTKPFNPRILISKVNIFLDLWHQHKQLAKALAENERYSRLLQRKAELDPLTGLPNRSLFNDRLRQAVLESKRPDNGSALLFIDLDQFKPVNDLLGHDAGDELLVQVARRLQECVRKGDTVARIGGDEFVVLAKGVTECSVIDRVANNILTAIAEPFHLGEETVHISASVGISILPIDSTDPEKLLQNADHAMYQAKASGRNRFSYFSTGLNADADERARSRLQLRSALDNAELKLKFLPKFNVSTHALTGAQALVSWSHFSDDPVQTDVLMQLAEEAGMPGPVRNWLFRTACESNKGWLNHELSRCGVLVDITSKQLTDSRGLVQGLEAMLKETRLPPENLELGISERVVMGSLTAALRTLEEVNQLGVRVCLRGNGFGFSLLSCLDKIPIQYLKLDRLFVHSIAADTHASTNMKSVMAFADKLSISVVADGVDTEEQVQALKQHGCLEMQGGYFCHPVDAGKLTEMLAATRPLASDE